MIFLILTLILGGVFLGIKAIEYHDKWVHHEVPGANFHPEDWPKDIDMSHASLYFALYFGLTGLHASHMIIGAGLLIFLIIKANRGAYTRGVAYAGRDGRALLALCRYRLDFPVPVALSDRPAFRANNMCHRTAKSNIIHIVPVPVYIGVFLRSS